MKALESCSLWAKKKGRFTEAARIRILDFKFQIPDSRLRARTYLFEVAAVAAFDASLWMRDA